LTSTALIAARYSAGQYGETPSDAVHAFGRNVARLAALADEAERRRG